jgi:hypothetical protein
VQHGVTKDLEEVVKSKLDVTKDLDDVTKSKPGVT